MVETGTPIRVVPQKRAKMREGFSHHGTFGPKFAFLLARASTVRSGTNVDQLVGHQGPT